MVWIEICEHKYNEKYDYMEMNLLNRYNEKFDKLIKFIKNHHSMISIFEIRGDLDKIVYINFDGLVRNNDDNVYSTSISAKCTDNQIRQIEKELNVELKRRKWRF